MEDWLKCQKSSLIKHHQNQILFVCTPLERGEFIYIYKTCVQILSLFLYLSSCWFTQYVLTKLYAPVILYQIVEYFGKLFLKDGHPYPQVFRTEGDRGLPLCLILICVQWSSENIKQSSQHNMYPIDI